MSRSPDFGLTVTWLNTPATPRTCSTIYPPWRSRHFLPRTRGKQSPQMLAIDSAGVRRSEDACQTPRVWSRLRCRPDAPPCTRGPRREPYSDRRRTAQTHSISNEELIAWREAHLGIESVLYPG